MSGESSIMSICALRVSRCGANGAPLWGNANGAWCAQEVGQLTITPDVVAGADIKELNGCGGLSVVRKYPDKVAKATLAVEFNTVDYRMMDIMCDIPTVTQGQNIIGAVFKSQAGCGTQTPQKACVIEAWSESILCGDLNPTTPYIRWVFPKCFMHISPLTLQMGLVKVKFEGYCQPSNNFGHGPFGDLDALDTIVNPSFASMFMAMLDDAALPTPCGAGSFLSLASYTSSS